jgi:hypothetical protein
MSANKSLCPGCPSVGDRQHQIAFSVATKGPAHNSERGSRADLEGWSSNLQAKYVLSQAKIVSCDGHHISSVSRCVDHSFSKATIELMSRFGSVTQKGPSRFAPKGAVLGKPKGALPQHVRPIRPETRATLVAAIARGRRWLDQLTTSASITTDSIARREGCSVRKVNMTAISIVSMRASMRAKSTTNPQIFGV